MVGSTITQTKRAAVRAFSVLARVVGLLAFVTLTACADPVESAPPGESAGRLSGTVTLLGPHGPPNPAGIRVALYATVDEMNGQMPRYTTSLRRIPGDVRSYEYDFEGIEAGEYYVIACFEFGCGGYHNPATGELALTRVSRGLLTSLHFGI